jgi:serine/threonine-protein kinase
MDPTPTDVPARLVAALADRYRIERPLGAGGMATVYLAEDLKHARRVAIKVLKPELAAVLGAERFLTEIKTTANLQHPHILPLFDSGEADTYLYYVMPFIDGESLRDRLDRERQLPVDEAVRLTGDIADALDYAHRHGVIHRDIKPANILLHDGRPLVADFGIALAISAAGGGRLTETGLSLGTPHYMSPEQASAERDLSARSDVYSLGCVLYEMLAGEPPHTGPNAAAILMRILTEQPRPISDLRATVPVHVASAVTRAVEKLPADRFESAKEFRQALEDPSFRFTRTTMAAAAPAGVARRSGWDTRSTVLAATAVAFAALAAWLALRPPAPVAGARESVSFQLVDSVSSSLHPTAGPHGWIAWVDDERLFARAPGSLEVTRPIGEDRVNDIVTFSPDGEWIAYVQLSGNTVTLRKTPARGGNPTTLISLQGLAFSPHWGDDGWIYLTTGVPGSWTVGRLPENGGKLDTLMGIGANAPYVYSKVPGHPALLLALFTGSLTEGRVLSLDLESHDTATVLSQAYHPSWSPTGHLLVAKGEGSLFAAPFDPAELRTTGPPVPVLDNLGEAFPLGRYSLSPEGSLVYVRGPNIGGSAMTYSLLLVNVGGGEQEIPLPPSDHWDAKFAPDGRRLAYIRNDHLWIYDLDLGTHTQLTRDGSQHHNPVWSPDGERVAFSAFNTEGASVDIFATSAAGGGAVARIGGSPFNDYASQWLPDSTILLNTQGTSGEDIYAISPGQDSARAVLHADWNERVARVSPDGRWMAFVSRESGRDHLYVRSWPGLGNKVQVSQGDAAMPGSGFPLWSADNRTLYYHQGTRLMAASVDGSGDSLRVTSRRMIREPAQGILADLHPDGRRLLFLGVKSDSDSTGATAVRRQLVVTTNWLAALRARMGTQR